MKNTKPREPQPITEPRTVGWRVWCHECGDSFESKRRDAETCSNKCRQLRYRTRNKPAERK